MEADPTIIQAIQRFEPDVPPAHVARELTKELGVRVSLGMVHRVRGSMERMQAVEAAKTVAASTLPEKMDVLRAISGDLYELFNGEGVALKDKLEIAKVLRTYLQLDIKTSGMFDETSDTLFVIGGEWATEKSENA